MEKTVDELMREPTLPTLEIGGIGPQYEDACQTALFRCVKYMEQYLPPLKDKNWDERMMNKLEPELKNALLELVQDIDLSGAMFAAALSHAFYIRRNGYAKWLETDNGRVIMWRPHLDWPKKN